VSLGQRPIRALLALVLALLGLAVTAPAALANADIFVNTTQDTSGGTCTLNGGICSLREALEIVKEGEDDTGEEVEGEVVIAFQVEGTIPLTGGELELEPAEGIEMVAIDGPGSDRLTIDGQEGSRIFSVEDANAQINGVTLTNGKLTGSEFFDHGGAAIFQGGGELTLNGVALTENSVESGRNGGAIYQASGNLVIRNSQIERNHTEEGSGAAIYGEGGEEGEEPEGGALQLDGVTVSGNTTTAPSGGSAGVQVGDGDATIVESTFTGNLSSGYGGGLYVTSSGGAVTVERSTFTKNKSGLTGGGVAIVSGEGTTTIVESTVAENEATMGGGGIFAGGEMKLERSTVSGNEVPIEAGHPDQEANGGGISGHEGPVTVTDSTIAGNFGGGVYMFGGPMTVLGSTIAGNSEPGKFSGGIQAESEVKLTSTVIAYNLSGEGSDECSGEIASGGYNIVDNANGCFWPPAAEDRLNLDPKLGPLEENGGPTETMAPTTRTSPAINHGTDPTATDQRGLTRPVPNSPTDTDVGAVEVQAPSLDPADPPAISPSTELHAGEAVHCSPGGWETDTVLDPSYSYVWLRDGSEVASGDDSYQLTDADAEAEITCEVTVDDGAASASATSAAVALMPAGVELAPSSTEFDSRNVGSGPGPAKTLTLTNTGGVTAFVSAMGSTDPEQFRVGAGTCLHENIEPTESCTFPVRFAPTAAGQQTATVDVETSAGPVSATVEGTGTEPAFAVSPTSQDFGERLVGSGPSAPQTFTVSNEGDGPMEIGDVATAGTNAGDFHLPAAEDHCSGATLAPADSCDVAVTFTPGAPGARTASLEFPGNAAGSAELEGTGTGPVFAVTPTSHDFGDAVVDAPAGPAQLFTVTNEGDGDMTVSEVLLEGAPDFTLSGEDTCSGATVEPGESCEVEVSFAAQQAGHRGGTLRFLGSAPGSAALEGTGTEPLFVADPTSLDFGFVDPDGGPTEPQEVTVENGGDAPLAIGAVTIEGDDAAVFSAPEAEDTCEGATLEPADTCTVTVGFDPVATGAASAELVFGGTSGTVPLSGTGAVGALAIEPAALDFGPVNVGTGPTAARLLTVTNSGEVAVDVAAALLEGPGAQQFSLASDGCAGAHLAPEGSCEVSLQYLATAAGPQAATVVVAIEGSGEPASAALSGSGVERLPQVLLAQQPGTRLATGNDGQVELEARCETVFEAPCEASLALEPNLGHWSGSIAPGAATTLPVRLTKAGRAAVGAKGHLQASAVLATNGGAASTTPLLLLAPPAPELLPRAVHRSGDSLVLALTCRGYQRNCQGRVTVKAGGRTLARGDLSLPRTTQTRRLPLTAAGQKLLESSPRPRLMVSTVAVDRFYSRQTASRASLRLR
jgi:CSLREA domain-containing protein